MKVIKTIIVASLGRLPLASQTVAFMANGEGREYKPGQMPADGGYVVTQTFAKVTAIVNQLGAALIYESRAQATQLSTENSIVALY